MQIVCAALRTPLGLAYALCLDSGLPEVGTKERRGGELFESRHGRQAVALNPFRTAGKEEVLLTRCGTLGGVENLRWGPRRHTPPPPRSYLGWGGAAPRRLLRRSCPASPASVSLPPALPRSARGLPLQWACPSVTRCRCPCTWLACRSVAPFGASQSVSPSRSVLSSPRQQIHSTTTNATRQGEYYSAVKPSCRAS
jgi:hypothetical protein